MRVLLVNKFWYPKGGSERYAFLLKDLLESHGHEVVPFAMADARNEDTPWSRFFVRHVDFDRGARSGIAAFGRMLWSRDAASAFDRLLDAARPDVVHLQNFAHQISPSILPRIARRGIPIVWTLHDYEILCPNYRMYTHGSPCERCKGGRYANAIRYRCMETLGASVAVAAELTLHHTILNVYGKHLDVVIAPSRFLAEKLREWGWTGRVEVIPNFVPQGSGRETPDARIHTSDPHSAPVLFVGRLTEEKGIEDFVAVAAQLPRIPFVVIGDGPLAANLKFQISNFTNLRWLGAQSYAQVAGHLRRAAFLVVPSRWYENAPYVVLEAMAAGVPVIASRVGGLPELVRDGETGVLVPPGDRAALVSATSSLYGDATRRARFGERARAMFGAEYRPDRHYARIMEIYRLLTRNEDKD